MKTKNLVNKITEKIKNLAPIDVSWCSSMVIENEKFNNIFVFAELNDFNYITSVNIHFHATDPPGFIYIGKMKVTEFNNKKELGTQIKKQIELANESIADAIFRAAQLELF